jgi:PAS domain S-box-containing protein
MADRMTPGTPRFLAGGGAMGALIRAHDWSSTELGPPQLWPVPLRTSIRLLLTTNHPVFLFWGPNHLCFYNDAYSASLGPEKHPSMLGSAGRHAWNEIWDVIGPQIEDVMAGRGATWHEDHLIPIIRHGRLEDVYWTYSYSPIDYDSAPHGVGGVLVLCTETTEKVFAAERMKAAEARWRGLFEQTPGFMCMLSGPRHVIDYANPQYLELVGRDDLVGKSVAEAMPWAIEQGFVQLLDRVYASGEAYAGHSSRISLPRPGGSTDLRYLDFVYQPIRDERGTVTGVFVLGTDVTERKAAEAALAQSEERLRLARDAAALGIHDYDIMSGAVEWDARTRALWGAEPDEPITYDVFMAGLHPEDRAGTQAAVDRALEPGADGIYCAVYRVINRKDRKICWVQATGKVTFNNGRPMRLVGTVQDITEQKQNEEAVRDADRRKNEFLATLAHELRSPLAPMRSALEMLKVAGHTDEAKAARAVLERQLSHLVRMIDDLMDAVRISRGRLDLRRERGDLADIVHDAVEAARPQLQSGGQELALAMPSIPLPLHVDRVRMAQVLSNLLINASKYSDRGTVIRLEAVTVDSTVEIRVIDRGIGISAEHLPRVFEMFLQVESAVHRSHGGLGIGLSLARGLIELHGGTIEARSDGPGCGSQFIVRLPLATTTADDDERERHAQTTTGRPGAIAGRRVLVVDDNEDAAITLAALLRFEDAKVEVAGDGPQALARVDSFRPEIILLDIGLPGLSGYDVCRRLREKDPGHRIVIMALTGWGQQEDRDRSDTAGFDGHLVKPIDYDNLIALTSELLARR